MRGIAAAWLLLACACSEGEPPGKTWWGRFQQAVLAEDGERIVGLMVSDLPEDARRKLRALPKDEPGDLVRLLSEVRDCRYIREREVDIELADTWLLGKVWVVAKERPAGAEKVRRERGVLCTVRSRADEEIELLLVRTGDGLRLDPRSLIDQSLVSYEAPTRFEIEETALGRARVDETYRQRGGFWLVRVPGTRPRLVAIAAVCTKLGASPNWLESDGILKCPACGSTYGSDGRRLDGPAPHALARYAVARDEKAGTIIVDVQKSFRQEDGGWEQPGAFLVLEETTPKQLDFATSDAHGFLNMGPPRPGDWLSRFDEPGQPFAQYTASRPVRAREGETLAFMPVGPFSEVERGIFDGTVRFARIWFDLGVQTLDDRPLPKKGWQRVHHGRRQFRTQYFLRNLLPDSMPSNAVCLFGVTMADLYPDDDWNYVFGQASLRGRVGVWSFARYFASFWGRTETDETRRTALRRALKVVVHEAGHTFGLLHCIKHVCVMNGSNNLDEADRRPLRLCPECLKKLQWNRGFDVIRRYERLVRFFRQAGLEPEARWIDGRLERIRAVR